MRPVFRLPSDASLIAASDTDLRLFVAGQKYNVRSKRLAERELQRRMTAMTQAAPRTSALQAPPTQDVARPKGSLADIAWLGVLLGSGALALHIISWWAPL